MSAARYARRGDTCLGKNTQNPPWLALTVPGASNVGPPTARGWWPTQAGTLPPSDATTDAVWTAGGVTLPPLLDPPLPTTDSFCWLGRLLAYVLDLNTGY